MKTILVVDDMAVFREPIASALRAKGYETVCAENGREALAVVRSRRPDVILLDVAMPVMDGLEFLRQAARDPTIPPMPVILLTAVAERDYIVKAAELGVSEYLLKSQFSLGELYARVERCLAGAAERTDGELPATDQRPPPAEAPADSMAALKSMKSLVTRSQVVQRLEACAELSAFSPAVTKVMKLARSDDCTLDQVAQAVKQDQAIALRILKLANSTVYTRAEPVETIERAVQRIGLAQIHQVMINISVIDQYGALTIGDDVDAGQFWEHAFACGLIAAEIAHTRSAVEADRAFTVGLVHDVGRIIYVQQFGEDYSKVLECARDLQLPLELVETRLLLLNHAKGMDRLLHGWKFPKELIDPIVMHHLSLRNIRRVAPRRVPEVVTLALANRLCHAMALGSSGNETIYPTETFCEFLAVTAEVIGRIEETAREQTQELKLSLLMSAGDDGGWTDTRERYRSALAEPLRPLFVSARPELDAFRIFCGQIAERGIEPPNVGIVHVADTGHRMQLSQTYAAEEARAGVKGLPLIILSTSGTVTLEPRVMAGRMHRLLPTPVTVARLLAAINDCLAQEGTCLSRKPRPESYGRETPTLLLSKAASSTSRAMKR